jgi:hypothetical protein
MSNELAMLLTRKNSLVGAIEALKYQTLVASAENPVQLSTLLSRNIESLMTYVHAYQESLFEYHQYIANDEKQESLILP